MGASDLIKTLPNTLREGAVHIRRMSARHIWARGASCARMGRIGRQPRNRALAHVVSTTTASQTERKPSICGDFRQKQPILQSLKRRVITGFLQSVTQSYY